MTTACEISIPASHASLAGHFPGNPVVPGVVILDAVRECLQRQLPDKRVGGITHCKFIDTLLPDQRMTVVLEIKEAGAGFRCLRGEQLIAQGECRLVLR